MYISARARSVLEFLLKQKKEVTISDVASAINVSVRTIHRDLKVVEDVIIRYNLSLEKRTGAGIQIYGEKRDISLLAGFLSSNSFYEFTSSERQSYILSTLLSKKNPIKLISLADELRTTVNAVSNDLDEIEKVISSDNLQLLRKRGYGVELAGKETDKRRAISKFISSHVDMSVFLSIFREEFEEDTERIVEIVNSRLLGLIDKQKLIIIEKSVQKMRRSKQITISDSAYVGLIVHLTLAIERISHGEIIHFDDHLLSELRLTNEYMISKELINGLEDTLNISINEAEIGYVTMHLLGSANSTVYQGFIEEDSLQVGMCVQRLLKKISHEINHDLTENVALFRDLVTHLKPALYRMKQNMRVSNPLLEEIKRDYARLFVMIHDAVEELFPELDFPDEEIGFIVIHIASTLLHFEAIHEPKVLVICASGIGTSKMLAARLQKSLPGVTAYFISMFEIENIDLSKYETIISTINLSGQDFDYLLVSPLLTNEEVEKIRKRIVTKKYFQVNLKEYERDEKTQEGPVLTLDNIHKLKKYSTAIFDVLKGFQVLQIEAKLDAEQILMRTCQQLNTVDDAENVVKSLTEREVLGGIAIPGTTLALYHARHKGVRQISFTMCRLEHPVVQKGMDGKDVHVRTFLLLLSPLEPTDEELEILSEISIFVIRDVTTTQLFQCGTETEIFTLLANELNGKYIRK